MMDAGEMEIVVIGKRRKTISNIIVVVYVILIYSFLIGGGIIYGWLTPMPMDAIFTPPLFIIFWLGITFWIIGIVDLILEGLEYRKVK